MACFCHAEYLTSANGEKVTFLGLAETVLESWFATLGGNDSILGLLIF